MVHRLATPCFGVHRFGATAVAAATAATLGCSLVHDFDAYGVARDAGTDAAGHIPLGPAVASFDSYYFERGKSVTFSVPREEGLLANDAPEARVRAETQRTTAGGSVRLAADGSFEYTPPGAPATFWGDDYFVYELLAEPRSSARVRLTVQPPGLVLSELSASGGAGFGVAGAAIRDSVADIASSFASAGDVNGDGLEDFIVGVRGPSILLGQSSSGQNIYRGVGRGAYVLFGKADAGDVSLAEDSPERAPGFAIIGDGDESRPTEFGAAVAAAGDVNGDGLGDVIVGSFGVSTGTGSFGAAYVVFGKTDAEPVSSAEIRAGNGGGFAIFSSQPGYDLVGFDVDGAGDVDGDALDDVIVGVPILDEANGGTAGGAVVVFGKGGSASVSVADVVAGSPEGFAIFGDTPGEFLGVFVAGVGDVNGDGLTDVAASTDATVGGGRGRNVIVFGKTDRGSVRADDIATGASSGFEISGADDLDGAARVARGGDVNADGMDDVLIAAPQASFGPPFAQQVQLPDVADAGDAGDAGVPIDPTPPGAEVASNLPRQGIVYVAFGGRELRSFNLRELERSGGPGFAIGSSERLRNFGHSLSSGDVDGDGSSDVIASMLPVAGFGRAFVVFGKQDTGPVVLPPPPGSAASVLTVVCPPAELACSSVASGSDANGDGLDDILFGSVFYADAPQAAGGAYLAFGWDVTGALEGRDAALIGGAADDVFDLPAAPLVIARGGRGTDTLRASRDVDLTRRGRYESLEIIDVRGNGTQTVKLDETALRRIPQNDAGFDFMLARRLTVLGDAEDILEFDVAGFDVRFDGAGRVVYGRQGAFYGLEISQGLRIQTPATP